MRRDTLRRTLERCVTVLRKLITWLCYFSFYLTNLGFLSSVPVFRLNSSATRDRIRSVRLLGRSRQNAGSISQREAQAQGWSQYSDYELCVLLCRLQGSIYRKKWRRKIVFQEFEYETDQEKNPSQVFSAPSSGRQRFRRPGLGLENRIWAEFFVRLDSRVRSPLRDLIRVIWCVSIYDGMRLGPLRTLGSL